MLAVTESSHFMLLECFTVGALPLTLAVWPLIISGTKGISTAVTAVLGVSKGGLTICFLIK